MSAPTKFITYTNPADGFVHKTPAYEDMEFHNIYEKGITQAKQKSYQLVHSKAHIRAYLENKFQKPFTASDATLKPSKKLGFNWSFHDSLQVHKGINTMAWLTPEQHHQMRIALTTGEMIAVSTATDTTSRGSTPDSSERISESRSPAPIPVTTSFQAVNKIKEPIIQDTPNLSSSGGSKKKGYKKLSNLGAGEHNMLAKQICSLIPDQKEVKLLSSTKRPRTIIEDLDGDDSDVIPSRKRLQKTTIPKSIPVETASGEKSTVDLNDEVIMKALFSGAKGVKELIHSTLQERNRAFSLKVQELKEEIRRLEEKVESIEANAISPEFLQSLQLL